MKHWLALHLVLSLLGASMTSPIATPGECVLPAISAVCYYCFNLFNTPKIYFECCEGKSDVRSYCNNLYIKPKRTYYY